MPQIQIETLIKSDIHVCFDLSRSIDLHTMSMTHTSEKAIGGVTSGLIEQGQFVTWQATHFLIRLKLTSKITSFNRPFHFRDEQIKGPFKSMVHDHSFEQQGEYVLMKDIFHFESPFGLLGSIVSKLILTKYFRQLLTDRNKTIKAFAESDKWKSVVYKPRY